MKLTPNDQAYNAAVDALNAYDAQLRDVLSERGRAWNACEALIGLGAHGQGVLSQKRINLDL